jgi:hypothetical protein
MIVNLYSSIVGILNFIKQTLVKIKGQIGLDAIILTSVSHFYQSVDHTDKEAKGNKNSTKKLHS